MNYSYDSFPDKLYAKDLLALGLGDFLKLGPIFHRVRALLRVGPHMNVSNTSQI